MRRLLLLAVVALLPAGARAQLQDLTVLCYHDVRDSVGGPPLRVIPAADAPVIVTGSMDPHLDSDQYAISTASLAQHFDWLHSNGYHVISLQTLVTARQQHKKLPPKAVLLTFDDGLHSVYTKVFPLLQAFNYPAVVAAIAGLVDLPAGQTAEFGDHEVTRANFVTWAELKQMQDSGLIEIASHSFDMHHGIRANPQGNLLPAAAAHHYDSATHTYETDDQYRERVQADLSASSRAIRDHLGLAPRSLMWPYGEYTQAADDAAARAGMPITFSLADTPPSVDAETDKPLRDVPRLIIIGNPDASDLAYLLQHSHGTRNIRAVQVDLDYVYDPDPAQQDRNLGHLVDRIRELEPTQVWLQAFADPDGTGVAKQTYFPGTVLPMRADLFSRAAWQLRTRCGVEVFGWLPVLSWQLPDAAAQARLQIRGIGGKDADKPVRLNPFLPETAKLVSEIYGDMGRAVPLAGVLFSDDAILRDTDDLGPAAPPPGRARTQALIAFTTQLQARTRYWSPQLLTARNLFTRPVLDPASESWYAQSLPAFLNGYDEIGLMAMPAMENAQHPDAWLKKLVHVVSTTTGALDKTVFELQTVDWRNQAPIDTQVLARQMQLLQQQGALHLGYYPDDFVANHPDVHTLLPAFSTASSPVRQP